MNSRSVIDHMTWRLARALPTSPHSTSINFRERPISSFRSVADVFQTLVRLPDDVNVPQMILEARRP